MSTLRTRFKDGIVAEFCVPKRQSHKVLIICSGLPTQPGRRDVLEFWSKKGYIVIQPRYRGTWESSGSFLENSPDQDIRDCIDELMEKKQLQNLWDKKIYQIEPREIFLLGISFGGAAALLLSTDPRVKKVVAISPVVDWTVASRAEPLSEFSEQVQSAFGMAYRGVPRHWKKLGQKDFYNPMAEWRSMDGTKIRIFHTEDDAVVLSKSVKQFAKKTGSDLRLFKRGGHLSMSILMKPRIYRSIQTFFF